MRVDEGWFEHDAGLAELACKILDRRPVDWDRIESRADEAHRPLIRELRLLAEITALHQGLLSASDHVAGRDAHGEAEGTGVPEYWGHLKIVERIGQGAFGEVFRAWDSRLDRDVALKLIAPLTEDSNRTTGGTKVTSIIEEGRLLARVRHPNVVTVYGAERISGRIGIWTELIQGRTLEHVVRAEGPVSAEEATSVGVDVCRALSAVHSSGLLHGDIKAQNVMREAGGRTVVMDFGAGRMQLEARSPSDDLAGTPLYLAPEVLEGQEATQRSEIYSVGVLLFHLVTGSYPVVARTLDDVREAHRLRRRRRLADERPDLPMAFVDVVDRALESDPSQRYDSPAAVEAALRTQEARGATPTRMRRVRRALALGAVAVLLSTAIALDIGGVRRLLPGSRDSREPGAVAGDPIRIAILPFVSAGGPDDDPIANGLAEDLIGRLNAVEGVQVIASASAFSFRGTDRPLREVGARLNVAAVLTGTVRRSGETLDVATRLVGVPDERELWRHQYARPVAELFQMQAEITAGVAESLRRRANGARRRWPTEKPDAYALYLRGRDAWAGRNQSGTRMALQLFEQAIALDPGFALAHAGVAMAYAQLSQLAEMSAEESYPKVAEAAARALSLDEMLPEAHIASSVVKTYERDQRGADYERRRAVELDPHSVFAREHYGMFLSLLGRFSEALEHARMAQSLDPLSPRAAWTVASVLRYARRYDEAIAEARRALQLDPNYGPAYHTLGLCYEAQGRLDEAIDAFLRSGRRPNGNLGHAYAVAGRINEARAIVAELEKHSPERGGMGHIAQVYVGLGDLERAFEWLSRGAERVPSQVPTLKVAEIWDPLRSDPRFLKLLEKEGLSEPQTVK